MIYHKPQGRDKMPKTEYCPICQHTMIRLYVRKSTPEGRPFVPWDWWCSTCNRPLDKKHFNGDKAGRVGDDILRSMERHLDGLKRDLKRLEGWYTKKSSDTPKRTVGPVHIRADISTEIRTATRAGSDLSPWVYGDISTGADEVFGVDRI